MKLHGGFAKDKDAGREGSQHTKVYFEYAAAEKAGKSEIRHSDLIEERLAFLIMEAIKVEVTTDLTQIFAETHDTATDDEETDPRWVEMRATSENWQSSQTD